MRKFILILALTGVMISHSGCFGEFALTKKLYTWNSGIGGKFVNNLVFWGLCIIPAYEVVGFIDVIILNTIEFWTGGNPAAMAPGDVEVQYANVDRRQFKMTAQHNNFIVEELTADGYKLCNEFTFDDVNNNLVVTNGIETKVFATK